MPGALSAQEIVSTVRDLIQHQGQNVYRDGFADDPNTEATPILRWVNRAFNELTPTGFCKCWFMFPTLLARSEYTLDEAAHEVHHVLIDGQPLEATTDLGLDSRSPGWQNSPNRMRGRPQKYYTYSDQLGLDPYPDGVYTVYYLADSYPGDLKLRADTPQRLPVRFHNTLAVRAAWWLSQMDVENETAAKRIPALLQSYQKDYVDLQALVNSRLDNLDAQIQAGDYRHDFGWRY